MNGKHGLSNHSAVTILLLHFVIRPGIEPEHNPYQESQVTRLLANQIASNLFDAQLRTYYSDFSMDFFKLLPYLNDKLSRNLYDSLPVKFIFYFNVLERNVMPAFIKKPSAREKITIRLYQSSKQPSQQSLL